jgi:hypothetical protein
MLVPLVASVPVALNLECSAPLMQEPEIVPNPKSTQLNPKPQKSICLILFLILSS